MPAAAANFQGDLIDGWLKSTKAVDSHLGLYSKLSVGDYTMSPKPRAERAAACMMVYSACKPLTTVELGSALGINVCSDNEYLDDFTPLDEAQLRDLWPDLLVLDSGWNSGGVWRFTHSSLAPAFFARNTTSGLESRGLDYAHRKMAECCLWLLVQARYGPDGASESPPDISDAAAYDILNPMHPLQIYARNYWINHLQALENRWLGSTETDSPRLSELLVRFLGLPTKSSKHFIDWYHQVLRDGPLGLRPESPRNHLGQASLDFIAPGTNPIFALVRFSLLKPLGAWHKDPGLNLSVTNKRNQTLLEVVADGKPESIAIAQQLVDLGADVNQPQRNEHGSALTHAAALGNLEWLRFLISRGADANASTGGSKYGSPLVAAAYCGNKEAIESLIEAGADVNLPLAHGKFTNALAAAADARKPAILQLLIDNGADVNARDESYNALVALVATGSIDCVQILIDAGADVRRTGKFGGNPSGWIHPAGFTYQYPNALYAAASQQNLSCLKALIMAGALDPSLEEPSYSGHALAITAAAGNLACVELLIQGGADVSETLRSGHHGSSLAAAASKGHLPCVRALLDAGADANQVLRAGIYGSALAAAAKSGDVECLQALLEAGADANQLFRVGNYGSALAAAAYYGHHDCVHALLQAGANPSLQLPSGKLTLGSALAASVENESCMRLLLDAGADVNQVLPPDDKGKGGSALAIAAERELPDTLQMLIDAGADVNRLHESEESRCGSALVAAAFAGSAVCLQALITAGAQVDQQVFVGFYGNALIAAAGMGELECVRALVAAGADINKQVDAPRSPCRTALAAAAYMARPQCASFLIRNGAVVGLKLEGSFEDALHAALAPVRVEEKRIWEQRRVQLRMWVEKKIAEGKAEVVKLLERHGINLEE